MSHLVQPQIADIRPVDAEMAADMDRRSCTELLAALPLPSRFSARACVQAGCASRRRGRAPVRGLSLCARTAAPSPCNPGAPAAGVITRTKNRHDLCIVLSLLLPGVAPSRHGAARPGRDRPGPPGQIAHLAPGRPVRHGPGAFLAGRGPLVLAMQNPPPPLKLS